MKRSVKNISADTNETQRQLITVLKELEDEVEKQNSWRQVFMRGALYGLGTVIGATFLLAILGSVIALTIDTLGIKNIPFVGTFVEESILKEIPAK